MMPALLEGWPPGQHGRILCKILCRMSSQKEFQTLKRIASKKSAPKGEMGGRRKSWLPQKDRTKNHVCVCI